jgi:chromosome condensin MukBEF MukE localization factor
MKPDSKSKGDQILTAITNTLIELAKTVDKPFVGGFNVIIKKSIFKQVHGFDENLKLAEDHDLAQRLLKSRVILHILKEPKVTISLRRFRREGTINLLRKYAMATSKFLFEGPITDQLFDYPMGGKVYDGQNKTIKLKFNQRLNKLKRYLNRINLSLY